MLYCYRNFIFGWSLSGMTGKKGKFFMEMNILVWFFLTKSYENELAISYLWSQDFLWWKIILVGKLTGCCEIYPFELSSAMSGDVVTEYTLWRTLLGKYCVMIYFFLTCPFDYADWFFVSPACLALRFVALTPVITYVRSRGDTYCHFSRVEHVQYSYEIFYNFSVIFFLFFSPMCWFDCFQYI